MAFGKFDQETLIERRKASVGSEKWVQFESVETKQPAVEQPKIKTETEQEGACSRQHPYASLHMNTRSGTKQD